MQPHSMEKMRRCNDTTSWSLGESRMSGGRRLLASPGAELPHAIPGCVCMCVFFEPVGVLPRHLWVKVCPISWVKNQTYSDPTFFYQRKKVGIGYPLGTGGGKFCPEKFCPNPYFAWEKLLSRPAGNVKIYRPAL